MTVQAAGAAPDLPPVVTRRAVRTVLDGENAGPAAMTVTFLSSQRMRALNRRTFGRDCATDVIAFGMPHAGLLVGDIYVCPPVADRAARANGVPLREELIRLVVHGTLHALGHEHPEADGRTRSAMWQVQERYVRALAGSA